MKRTRLMIVATLLFAILFTGCGNAVQTQEEAAVPEEAQQMEESYPFQDFPAEAYPKKATSQGGKVTPAKVETDLFHAKFEGDAVSGSGGAVGGKYHFIATQTDGESWHVKLEANYPTVAGRDYFVTYRFTSDVAGTVKFGDFQEYQIHEGENSITGNFTAKEGTSYIDLQLGLLPAFTIDFTDIEVKEYADEVDYEDALPKPIDFERESRVYERHDAGYETVLVRASHAININYESIPTDLGVWKSKLYVKTGMVPEPGVRYRVTADVMSDRYERNIPFELLFNDGEVEKGYGALYGLQLVPGEVKTCEAVITGNGNGDELILQFSLGEARAGSLIIVGNVHVDKITDHYTSALAEDFALDKDIATGKLIEEQTPVSYTDITPANFSYQSIDTVYEQHDDGYVVNLTEDASSATMAITRAPGDAGDRGVWKAKLYAATGLSLKPGKSYLVKFDLTSAKDQAEYEVCFDGDAENAYGALYGRSLTAGGTDHIEMLLTPSESQGPLTVRMQLGKTDSAAGNTVTFKNFSVEAVDVNYTSVLPNAFSYDTGAVKPDVSYVSVLPDDFSYDTSINVYEQHADGFVQSVSATSDSATLDITTAPEEGRDLWNSKLYINTGVTPEAGTKYAVSFDVTAKKAQAKYEACFDGASEGSYGTLYDQSLSAGTQTVNYTFMPDKSDGPLVLRLQLGQTDDTSGNTITVSNIQVKPVTATATSLGDISYVTGVNVREEHGDGIEQTVSASDASATLNVTQARTEGGVWSSRLFVATGVTPKADARYRVSATVASTQALDDFEVVYDNGDAEDGYGNKRRGLSVAAGGTETVTTDITAPASGCDELVLRFNLGNSPADNTITVSDIQVCEITEGEAKEIELKDFAYPNGEEGSTQNNSFDLETNSGAEAVLTGDGDSATATVTKHGDDWHVKLYAKPGLAVKEGETYEVSMNVTGATGTTACYKNTATGAEDGFGTELISDDGAVIHTFKAGADGTLEILLKIGNVPDGTAVNVSEVKISKAVESAETIATVTYPETTPESTQNNSFELEANSGAAAKLTGDGSSATATVTTPGDDWHVKLYAKPGVELEAGKTYKISMDVEGAAGCQAAYKNTATGAEDGFGTEAITGDGTVTHTVTPTESGTLEILLKVGNVAAGSEVTVRNVMIEVWGDKNDDITGIVNYSCDNDNPATVEGNKITIGTSPNVDWMIKFYAVPDVTLEADKAYRIVMSVTGANGCPVCFKNTAADPDKAETAFGETTVSADGTVTHDVTPEVGGALEILLKLGTLPDGSVVTINSVKVYEVTQGFVPVELPGFAYPETTPESTQNNSFELEANSGAAAKLTGDGESATATVTTPGDDWHVKLYAKTGVELEAGKTYKVSMDVEGAAGCQAAYKNTATGAEDGFGTEAIVDGTVTHTVTPTESGTLEILLKVGNVAAGSEVTVRNVEVKEVATKWEAVSLEGFDYPVTNSGDLEHGSFELEANSGAAAKLSGDGSSAKATVTKRGDDWNVKLYAKPGVALEAGKTYKVSMDVEGAAGCQAVYKNTATGAEDGFGTEAIVDGTVAHVVKANEDGTLEIVLKIGNVADGTVVTVKGVKVEEIGEDVGDNLMTDTLRSWAPVNFWAHDGYKATLTDNGSSAKLTVSDAPSAEREAWKVKLFVETGMTLEAGKTYRVTTGVRSTQEFPYEICYNNGAAEAALGKKGDLTANGSPQTTSFDVTPEENAPLVIQFSLGNAAADTTATVSNITVEELDETMGDNLMMDALKAWAPVHQWVDADYAVALTNDDSSATMAVASVADERVDWKAKLFVETGAKLEAGKQYRISYDLMADSPFDFNVFYNNGAEEKAVGEFYELHAGSGSKVEHLVRPSSDSVLNIQVMVGNTGATNNIKISNVQVDEVIGGAPDRYPINFWAHEDYAASLTNDASSASLAITKVPAEGREAWKVKLFAETGAELKAGKMYRVSVDVQASDSMDYEICYNNGGEESALGVQWGLKASTSKSTVTYNVTPTQDSVLTLQLNLGNASGPNTMTISNVKVEEISYASATNAIPGYRYDSAGFISRTSDAGYLTSLEKHGDSATFRIKQAPEERHAWNAKVVIRTGITPETGMGYRITFDVDAEKPQNLFEVFYNGTEELAYDGLYEKTLAAGKNTFEYTIMPGDSKGPLVLHLRFGETNGTDGNAYTISNFKIEKVPFVTTQRAEIKGTVENDVQDGYVTRLTKTQDRAKLKLETTPAEGREAWKNKLFVYSGTQLKSGEKYRVSMKVRSIIPTPFEVCYNNGDVEKGIGAIFGLTSQAAGEFVEYTTYMKEDAYLVIQLSLGNCVAPNTIFLDDVKVEKAGNINLVSDTIYHF